MKKIIILLLLMFIILGNLNLYASDHSQVVDNFMREWNESIENVIDNWHDRQDRSGQWGEAIKLTDDILIDQGGDQEHYLIEFPNNVDLVILYENDLFAYTMLETNNRRFLFNNNIYLAQTAEVLIRTTLPYTDIDYSAEEIINQLGIYDFWVADEIISDADFYQKETEIKNKLIDDDDYYWHDEWVGGYAYLFELVDYDQSIPDLSELMIRVDFE